MVIINNLPLLEKFHTRCWSKHQSISPALRQEHEGTNFPAFLPQAASAKCVGASKWFFINKSHTHTHDNKQSAEMLTFARWLFYPVSSVYLHEAFWFRNRSRAEKKEREKKYNMRKTGRIYLHPGHLRMWRKGVTESVSPSKWLNSCFRAEESSVEGMETMRSGAAGQSSSTGLHLPDTFWRRFPAGDGGPLNTCFCPFRLSILYLVHSWWFSLLFILIQEQVWIRLEIIQKNFLGASKSVFFYYYFYFYFFYKINL